MKPILALIITKQGALQNGLLALLTTVPQISTVLVAEDADSGLRMLQDHRPRLLLLDMDLPEDGPQAILKQSKSETLHISTIALVDSEPQREKAESLKVDGVLFKGFSATKLISTIEEVVEQ